MKVSMLHHISPQSQSVYTQAELHHIRDALDAGYRNIRVDDPSTQMSTIVSQNLLVALSAGHS